MTLKEYKDYLKKNIKHCKEREKTHQKTGFYYNAIICKTMRETLQNCLEKIENEVQE